MSAERAFAFGINLNENRLNRARANKFNDFDSMDGRQVSVSLQNDSNDCDEGAIQDMTENIHKPVQLTSIRCLWKQG